MHGFQNVSESRTHKQMVIEWCSAIYSGQQRLRRLCVLLPFTDITVLESLRGSISVLIQHSRVIGAEINGDPE